MKITVATNNAHKKAELNLILQGYTLLLPGDHGIQFDCDETGSDYLENSLLKAKTLFNQIKSPVLADDSGLSVDALDGAPGIYSARYGSLDGKTPLSDGERNTLLLRTLEGVENRSAHFICCMTLILDEQRIYTVQECFSGEISLVPYGEGGFGYDPIFFLPEYGKTVSELPDSEKNSISHRAKAGRSIKALLDGLNAFRVSK